MFILLGYLSLTLLQLYRQYQRRRLYFSVMLRALRNGSVLVQRGKITQSGSVNTWLNSPSASGSRRLFKETQLPCDEVLSLSVICPRQAVDLSTWTSYLDIQPAQDSTGSVIALLEAGRPENLETFQASSMKVPQANRVHVLKHGCPIAWKAGSPFGIILHCNYNDFILMCDAFGQGWLTLDSDLELYRILTVSTIGKPRSLQQASSEVITVTTDKGDSSLTAGPEPPDSTLLLVKASSSPVATEKLDSTAVISGTEVSVAEHDKPLAAKTDFLLYNSSPVHDSLNGSASGALPTSNGTDHVKLSMGADKQLDVTNGQVSSESDMVCQTVNESKPTTESGDQQTANYTSQDENTSPQTKSNGHAVVPQIGNAVPDNLPQPSKDTNIIADNQTNSSSQESVRNGSDQKLNEWKKASNGEAVLAQSLASSGEATLAQSLASNGETTLAQSLASSGEATLAQSLASNGEATLAQSLASNSDATLAQSPVVTKPPESPQLSNSCPRKTPVASSPSKPPSTPQSATSSPGKPSESSPSDSSPSPANGTNGVNGASQDRKFIKPPNVVVYCGIKDTARKFEIIKTGLEQCLNMEAYTVYLLHHDEFMSMPWEDNAVVLIISHDFLHDNISKKCTDYLLKGGKVVSFSSSMEAQFVVRKEVRKRPIVAKFGLEKWREVNAVQGCYHYIHNTLKKDNSSMDMLVVDPKTGEPLVVQLMLSADHGNGRAIFSQLLLERDPTEMAVDSKSFSSLKQSNKERLQVFRHLLSLLDLDTSVTPHPALTPCYILAEDQSLKQSLMDVISQRMNKGIIRSRNYSLKFVSTMSEVSALKAINDTLPVITDLTLASGDGQPGLYFDPKVYWDHLTSSVMGRVVFYTDIIHTTMNVFEGIQFSIPENLGLIAVAGRQTGGKGRGGNTWLSPVGCAMFTLPLHMSADSPLGQHMTFLQHIASLAIVHSIRSIPGYQDLDLRLKWPNDIYYGNQMKLGGVLVNSTMMGSTVYATIGCGVNVSNSQPTICINDVIQQHNRDHHLSLSPLSASEVLARSVSALEKLVAQFQAKGQEDFCQLYYKYWLHSGARVRVESEGNAEVEICGLDDFGFLRVINKQGQQLTLQPDGNSFDMLRNLIAIKRD